MTNRRRALPDRRPDHRVEPEYVPTEDARPAVVVVPDAREVAPHWRPFTAEERAAAAVGWD